MGTYAYCLGEMDIPEEHRAEYARQVLEILRAGGMMTVEELPLYRRKIYLLSPPELDEEGRAKGCYNYFERTSWESWGLSAKRGTFGSNKVGCAQFCQAVVGAYILSALWSRSFMLVMVDGRLVFEKEYIAWFNYVLGTKYSNQRATRLDEIARLLHDEDRGGRHALYRLLNEVPFECIDRTVFCCFCAACCWAEGGERNPVTEEQMAAFLKDRTIDNSRTLADYISRAVCAFRDGGGTLGEAEALLKMTSAQRAALYEADRANILPRAYNWEPTALSDAQTAVEFGADFWEVWDRVKDGMTDGKSEPMPPCPPEEPLSTREFFDLESDQMTYFWQPDGDIQFSGELTAWMRALRTELDSIMEEIPPERFLETLVNAIDATNCTFFREAFYELISRQRERKVQSAVLLMQRLAARETPEQLWQYAALLGNPALRQEMLGF